MMLTVGALSFLSPLVLLGLVALPVLWWLLRVAPPSPTRIRFPAIRLLFDLHTDEETPARMPPWLLALRLALAGFLLLALAHPVWNARDRIAGAGPLVLAIDTGWAAASTWDARRDVAADLLDEAEREGREVVLIPTAFADRPSLDVVTAREARLTLDRLEPLPFAPRRDRLLEPLDALEAGLTGSAAERAVVWLSDGLTYGAGRRFAETLERLGPLTILQDRADQAPLTLTDPHTSGLETAILVRRPEGSEGSARSATVRVLAADGRVLASTHVEIPADALEASAIWRLPVEIRNRASRFVLAPDDGGRSAAGVFLLDAGWRRRPVGLISGDGARSARPLLSDLFYLRRALGPYADLREGRLGQILETGLAVLILSDIGQIPEAEQADVTTWVEDGGVLIRFAGPRLAGKNDDLLPVEIRRGGRALGGALSWDTPQKLAPFDPSTPFQGLAVSEEVIVERQVLAEPAPDLDARIWARLEDGTPLVTGERKGRGWLVLVHVTANQDWSNLPLSGLYVDMLRRLIALSPGLPRGAGAGTGAGTGAAAGPRAPQRVLDGFGRLIPPPPETLALPAGPVPAEPDARHPPGLYGRDGQQVALNVVADPQTVRILPNLEDLGRISGFFASTVFDLRPWLIALVILLGLGDLLATLSLTGQAKGLSGRLAQLRFRTQSGAVRSGLLLLGLAGAMMAGTEVRAQDAAERDAAEKAGTTHLAYVITDDAASDSLVRDGLAGLGQVLSARTAFEPGTPVGVRLGRDTLVFYPLIYWRLSAAGTPPSPEALAAADTYMRNGGTILLDSADQADRIPGLDATGARTARTALRTVLNGLDVPPLAPVPTAHVLGRAFYLLKEFPGRHAGGQVWVEAPTRGGGTADAANPLAGDPERYDGVSPLIVGSNDWAGAWARAADGSPVTAVVPGGERQRELAYRFGVNLVMYTLTGNYKADQVHVPAILERLGQ